MITVVGLGPAGPEHLTQRTLDVIDSSDVVWLRTTVHPSAAAVLDRRPDARSFDEVYETEQTFDAVYEVIVSALMSAAAQGGTVCYAVPGSPTVCERTVELLGRAAGGAPAAAGATAGTGGTAELEGPVVEIVAAVSFLDLVWARLGIDPVTAGVHLADAATIRTDVARVAGGAPVLVAQTWSRQLLSDVKLAVDEPLSGQRAVILHHLGLPDELVLDVAWEDLDRAVEPDHLTSVFVPSFGRAPGAEITELAETVALLRDRCPWDREQTHVSLVRHLLEETYEAIEAIEGLGADPAAAPTEAVEHAREELGDLLCQVVFHATLAAEEGLFTLADVAAGLREKLIARHPHVFGSVTAATADDVVEGWERAKDRSKQRTHLLDGIPAAMPALARAEKTERKLRSVGLGWERSGEPAGRLAGRLTELGDGSRASGEPDEASAGDLLLLVARRIADLRIDPETALRHALERLGERVAELEGQAAASGRELPEWLAELGDGAPVHEKHLPLC